MEPPINNQVGKTDQHDPESEPKGKPPHSEQIAPNIAKDSETDHTSGTTANPEYKNHPSPFKRWLLLHWELLKKVGVQEWLIVAATIAMAVSTGVYTYYAKKQWKVMDAQLALSQSALSLQARPWVAPYSAIVTSTPSGQHGTVIKLDIRDFGAVPAFQIAIVPMPSYPDINILKSTSDITVMSDLACQIADLKATKGGAKVRFSSPDAPSFRGGPKIPGWKTESIPIPKELGSYLFPGTSIFEDVDIGWLGFGASPQIAMGADGPTPVDQLSAGLVGCITYFDQAKAIHHTTFCFTSSLTAIGKVTPNQQLVRCGIHERAD